MNKTNLHTDVFLFSFDNSKEKLNGKKSYYKHYNSYLECTLHHCCDYLTISLRNSTPRQTWRWQSAALAALRQDHSTDSPAGRQGGGP